VDDKRRTKISKFVSLVLRHQPETAGLTLEPGGWVPVAALLTGAANAGIQFTTEELREVVRCCDKQRFGFDDTGTKIRANQGHSAEVELHFTEAEPPAVLYHGTADRNFGVITRDGILKMARHHVHLSTDTDTAKRVGGRHGKPVVFAVDAAAMRAAGHTFFHSANGVWLVEHVPPQYLRVL
jgi:putative RNA 2'-phosphotransferase